MRIKRGESTENLGFSMTPMIDIVFQLIIFFMLVSDFMQTDLERVWLPLAPAAVEDNKPDKNRLVINIAHNPPGPPGSCKDLQYNPDGELLQFCLDETHWKIKIKGQEISRDELEKEIRLEGDKNRPSGGISNRAIMIRSDAGAPYRMVQKVFEACARARVWKIEIGATKPAED